MKNEIQKHTHQPTGTTSITKRVIVKGHRYRVTEYKGRFNYVEVCKENANPFGGRIGTDFKTWDEAARHYKSPEMKTALLVAELELNLFK